MEMWKVLEVLKMIGNYVSYGSTIVLFYYILDVLLFTFHPIETTDLKPLKKYNSIKIIIK